MKDLKEHVMESLQINEGFGYRNLKALAEDITMMKEDGSLEEYR